jgi:hypothetical protein
MIKIISNHESAQNLFEGGVLATISKDVENPVEHIIDYLEGSRDESKIMILRLIDEAVYHDELYYSQNGVTAHYEAFK